jgi:hydrogenase nickel incorporation protein HypA/HybF
MHELSIALDLIDLSLAEAERLGNVRVSAVRVLVGPLSGVVSSALSSAFELAAEGTALQGVRLEVVDEAITGWCDGCQAIRTLPDPWSRDCPSCDCPVPELLTGDALQLTALEVVDIAAPAASDR